MQVVDFSDTLPDFKDGKTFVFNPSVAHWKDDLYLCVYRVFSRGFKPYRETQKPKDRRFDKNHPWFVNAPWDYEYGNQSGGRDDLGCAILKIRDGDISLVQNLSNRIFEGANKFFTFPSVTDPRLLHYRDDLFIISYNVTYTDGKVPIRAGFLELTTFEGAPSVVIHEAQDFCKAISQKIEKNWSFWKQNDGSLFFSYNISPVHEIVATKLDMKRKRIECLSNKILDTNDYFGLLEKCYNSGFEHKSLFISVTTPAVQRKDKSHRYLGVGHLKFRWSRHADLRPGSPLDIFYKENFEIYKNHHPYYDYFMFIYEFDSTTFELTNISDFFIPKPDQETGVLLAFPSGIEYDQNSNLMIFYGDGDSFCKMLLIKDPEDTLNRMLKFPIVEDRIDACSLLPGPNFYLL